MSNTLCYYLFIHFSCTLCWNSGNCVCRNISGISLFQAFTQIAECPGGYSAFQLTEVIERFLWVSNFCLQAFLGRKIFEFFGWLGSRWLNTVLAVCEYMSFAKSWQEKGCSSKAETWQVKNILMKDFDGEVKLDVFAVSMATWMIEYNLKISLFFSLHKIRSLDFPINLHTAYYN